jgi:hypothetical protein
MAFHADYDHIDRFNVDPVTLETRGKNLKDLGQTIADSIDRINNIWSELKLGWMGNTADEAKDYIDRWNAVMDELFGSEKHPEKGVLNAIVEGVLTTAANFAVMEHSLFEFFTKFQQGLAGGSGSSDDSTPKSITDSSSTAVSETWG